MIRARTTTGRKARRKNPTPPPDDQWRIPDVLWERIRPLLPRPKRVAAATHNPATDPRKVMDAIFFVLRTGCQWNALNATGVCSSSSAHRWFQTWTKAGVFRKLWARSLKEYDELKGIDWAWQSMDGAMTKAPLGGEKHAAEPHRPGQARRQAEPAVRRPRRAHRPGGGRGQPE